MDQVHNVSTIYKKDSIIKIIYLSKRHIVVPISHNLPRSFPGLSLFFLEQGVGFFGDRYCISQMRGPDPRQRASPSALPKSGGENGTVAGWRKAKAKATCCLKEASSVTM